MRYLFCFVWKRKNADKSWNIYFFEECILAQCLPSMKCLMVISMLRRVLYFFMLVCVIVCNHCRLQSTMYIGEFLAIYVLIYL